MRAPNLIHGLTLDVAYDGDTETSESLAEWLRAVLLPVVDLTLAGQDRQGQVCRIERLEIDLGSVTRDEAEGELARLLQAQLADALRWATVVTAQPAETAETAEMPQAAAAGADRVTREGAQLLEFLRNGRLPWTLAADAQAAHEQLLRQVLASPSAATVLASVLQDPSMLTRLVRQFSAAMLREVATVLHPNRPQPQAQSDAPEAFWIAVLRGKAPGAPAPAQADPALAQFHGWKQRRLDMADQSISLPELRQWLIWWLMHDANRVNQDCSLMLEAINSQCEQVRDPVQFMKLVLNTLRDSNPLDLDALAQQADHPSKPAALDAITTLTSHQAIRNFVAQQASEQAELGNLNSAQLHQLVRGWIGGEASVFLKAIEIHALRAGDAHRYFRRILQSLLDEQPIDLESLTASVGRPPVAPRSGEGHSAALTLQHSSSQPQSSSSPPQPSPLLQRSPSGEAGAEAAPPASPLPPLLQQSLPQRLASAMLQADLTPLELYWPEITRFHADILMAAVQRYLRRPQERMQLIARSASDMLIAMLKAIVPAAGRLVEPVLLHAEPCNSVLPEPLSSEEFRQHVLNFAIEQALDGDADSSILRLIKSLLPAQAGPGELQQVAHAWRAILPTVQELEHALFGNRYLQAVELCLQEEDDAAPALRAMLAEEVLYHYPELMSTQLHAQIKTSDSFAALADDSLAQSAANAAEVTPETAGLADGIVIPSEQAATSPDRVAGRASDAAARERRVGSRDAAHAVPAIGAMATAADTLAAPKPEDGETDAVATTMAPARGAGKASDEPAVADEVGRSVAAAEPVAAISPTGSASSAEVLRPVAHAQGEAGWKAGGVADTATAATGQVVGGAAKNVSVLKALATDADTLVAPEPTIASSALAATAPDSVVAPAGEAAQEAGFAAVMTDHTAETRGREFAPIDRAVTQEEQTIMPAEDVATPVVIAAAQARRSGPSSRETAGPEGHAGGDIGSETHRAVDTAVAATSQVARGATDALPEPADNRPDADVSVMHGMPLAVEGQDAMAAAAEMQEDQAIMLDTDVATPAGEAAALERHGGPASNNVVGQAGLTEGETGGKAGREADTADAATSQAARDAVEPVPVMDTPAEGRTDVDTSVVSGMATAAGEHGARAMTQADHAAAMADPSAEVGGRDALPVSRAIAREGQAVRPTGTVAMAAGDVAASVRPAGALSGDFAELAESAGAESGRKTGSESGRAVDTAAAAAGQVARGAGEAVPISQETAVASGTPAATVSLAAGRTSAAQAEAALAVLLMRAEALGRVEQLAAELLLQRLLRTDSPALNGALETALSQPAAIERLATLAPAPVLAQLLVRLQPVLAAQLPAVLRAVAGKTSVHNIPAMQSRGTWRTIYQGAFVAADPVTPAEFIRNVAHALGGGDPAAIKLPQPVPVSAATPQDIMKRLLQPITGQPAQDRQHEQENATPDAGESNIRNAGMVIIATYAQRLFSILELTKDGAFVSEEAAQRAVHLLQYAITGASATPEYQLTLNKLLCGIHGGKPIARGIDITDKEKDTIEQMLNGVIAHWKALGKTSIAGLRQTFLQREGRLSFEDDGWRLAIPTATFDMLLDRLPWSFAMIKFPWMEHPLHVTWR